MSWFGDIITNIWRPRKWGSTWYYPLASANNFQDVDHLIAFNQIPELNAVISMKARAFANGVMKEVDMEGKDVQTSDGQALINLLKNPNWFQGGNEFLQQTKVFHELYGNEYLYTLFPVGFDIKRTKTIYTLPPNIVRCRFISDQPFFMFSDTPPGVEYTLYTTNQKLPTEQIIHFNDNRVTIMKANDPNLLNGESKLKSLSVAVNNIRMAYESRGMILKYRGSEGIISSRSTDTAGSIPITKSEKDIINQAYSGYGTLEGQSRMIVSDTDLRYQATSVSDPEKLGLFKETEADFNKILDSYGVPGELFVGNDGATYENQHTAQRGLYQNTIIPEAESWCIGMSKRFGLEKTRIKLDYMHLPVFQEDLDSRGTALSSIVTALSQSLADGAISIQDYKDELLRYGIGKA